MHALKGVGHEVNNFFKASNITCKSGYFLYMRKWFSHFQAAFKMKINLKFLFASLKTPHHIFCPGFFSSLTLVNFCSCFFAGFRNKFSGPQAAFCMHSQDPNFQCRANVGV